MRRHGRASAPAASLAAVAVILWSGVTAPAQEVTPEEPSVADSASPRSELTDPAAAELDARAAEVAAELRCPVCRNQSVLESNAELSREMQDVVRERLAAGETPEEVKAYFVSRYGEWILLKPPAQGINLVVYLLPLVALLLGAAILRGRLRKWATAGAGERAETGPELRLDAEDAAGPPATDSGESEWLSPENQRWLKEALRE